MDNIRKLEELKNEIKILSNKENLKYIELEKLYSDIQIKINELEDLIIEIKEQQSI